MCRLATSKSMNVTDEYGFMNEWNTNNYTASSSVTVYIKSQSFFLSKEVHKVTCFIQSLTESRLSVSHSSVSYIHLQASGALDLV